MIELATAAATRFGWTWEYVFDGIGLGVLALMLRTAARQAGTGGGEWCADEMELADWMELNGKLPGDDMSGFFEDH